jgi:hypothetical protein
VAGRADGFNPGNNYFVSLYDGVNLLSSVTPVVPITSVWTTLSTSYVSGNSPVGDLTVVISSPVPQFDFDNVILTSAAVPEPATLISGAMLLLPFGSRAVRQLRKKFQTA